MRVQDILNITEKYTIVQIYDSLTGNSLLAQTPDKAFEEYMDREVVSINTDGLCEFNISFELVVK